MNLMFGRLQRLVQHPEFRRGAVDATSLAPGLAAWGLMTGVAMIKSGMSMTEALAMALLVFAGSSQLAALPLLTAGAPLWVILATVFCVNLRFVVFSVHLRDYYMHLPRPLRLVVGYLTADQSYVLLTRRFPDAADPSALQGAALAAARQDRVAFVLGTVAVNWTSWQVAGLLGLAMAHSLPTSWGLGFAGILCLLGIQCSLASSRLRVLSAVVAGVTAVCAFAFPLKLNIVTAIAMAVLVSMLAEHAKPILTQGGRA